MQPLIDKSKFIGLDQCVWLYNGAEVPPLEGSLEQIVAYVQNRGKGLEGRKRNSEVELACKANVAQLLNGQPEYIAFMSNSSEAISSIAQSIPFDKGDNVVINTLEFPSGVLPWLRLKERGLEVRIVNHINGEVSVEDILAEVDARTRVVITSHVSYLTGARLDYKRLYEHLKNSDTLLLLDATQSLGVVPVDMNYADFVVCSSYKWLLAVHGASILAVNPVRTQHVVPQAAGWRSVTDMFGSDRFASFDYHADARRFELGYPSYPTLYAMQYSTALLLKTGIDRIEQHVLALGRLLIAQLKQAGYEVMTPEDESRRAGNISFKCADGEQVANMLSDKGVYVWGGDGRVRASIHLFNERSDIERLVELLPVATGAVESNFPL